VNTLALTSGIAAGLFAGALSGVFGIGGGIVLVPLLALLLGLDQHKAQGITLAVLILPIGLPAVLSYLHHTSIRWSLVVALVVGFVLGVTGGARVANWIPEVPLRVLFILFLVGVGIHGWKGEAAEPGVRTRRGIEATGHGLWIGLLAGALSGLLGIGGGIVMVPLLVHVLGLSRMEAQGTSLAAMLPPIGLPGVLVYASAQGELPWRVIAIVVVGFAAGALAGARIAARMSSQRLERAFSVFAFCVAAALGLRML